MLKYVRRPTTVYHPTDKLLPKGFIFPKAYLEYVKRKEILELDPWHFMCHESKLGSYDFWITTLKEQYPSRQLVPFAKWEETYDDLACFEPSNDPNLPTIHYIHTFTKPGYEERGKLNTFEEWLEESIYAAEQYQTENPNFYEDLAYEVYRK